MVSMRKSRLSVYKQDRLIEHFVAGTTARCAAALVGVNFKTSAYYFHRLREIIAGHLEQEADTVFSGEIEVDESYFGGKRKGKRGRGPSAAGSVMPISQMTRYNRHQNALRPRLKRRWRENGYRKQKHKTLRSNRKFPDGLLTYLRDTRTFLTENSPTAMLMENLSI